MAILLDRIHLLNVSTSFQGKEKQALKIDRGHYGWKSLLEMRILPRNTASINCRMEGQ